MTFLVLGQTPLPSGGRTREWALSGSVLGPLYAAFSMGDFLQCAAVGTFVVFSIFPPAWAMP